MRARARERIFVYCPRTYTLVGKYPCTEVVCILIRDARRPRRRDTSPYSRRIPYREETSTSARAGKARTAGAIRRHPVRVCSCVHVHTRRYRTYVCMYVHAYRITRRAAQSLHYRAEIIPPENYSFVSVSLPRVREASTELVITCRISRFSRIYLSSVSTLLFRGGGRQLRRYRNNCIKTRRN